MGPYNLVNPVQYSEEKHFFYDFSGRRIVGRIFHVRKTSHNKNSDISETNIATGEKGQLMSVNSSNY